MEGSTQVSRVTRLRSMVSWIPVSVRKDYAATIAVQMLTVLLGLLLFHVVAQTVGAEGFGQYQVARGLIATLHPVATIGLVLGLQRYVPRVAGGGQRLVRQAFWVQLAAVTAFGAVGWLLARDLADLLGVIGGTRSVLAAFVALGGVCLVSVSAAGLRGTHQVRRPTRSACWVWA